MYKRDLIIQFVTAGILCILLSFLFASFEHSSNGSSYVGFNYRNAIPYLFYFIGAAIPSLIVGLLFRLNENLKKWMRKNYWINIIISVFGIVVCLFSLKDSNIVVYEYRMDGMDFKTWCPNYSYQVSGWFITIFSILNIYFPENK